MVNTIAADDVVKRFQIGATDFRDLGQCTVIGEFDYSGTITVENKLYLGELVFEEVISFNGIDFSGDELFFGEAVFKKDFILGGMSVVESSIYFESATFEGALDFDCNDLDCCLHLGSVNVLGEIKCIGAMSAESWIYAGDRPAVAWVLQQTLLSNIQYQIADAPPWLQRPKIALD